MTTRLPGRTAWSTEEARRARALNNHVHAGKTPSSQLLNNCASERVIGSCHAKGCRGLAGLRVGGSRQPGAVRKRKPTSPPRCGACPPSFVLNAWREQATRQRD